MANRFAIVTGRKRFFELLNVAVTKTNELVLTNADKTTLHSFAAQLAAITKWTANGRKPTFDERKSITMGVAAQREIQGTSNAELAEFLTMISALDSYFKFWRTDAGLHTLDDTDWRLSFPDDCDFSDE
jgi:hypothetical protein